MEHKQNLHTHSTFCDGVNTPREMINIAIDKGFASIGFSEHSPMYYSPSYGMSPENTQLYIEEIFRLKKEYEGKFDVFCGIEYDVYSDVDLTPYEYVIASLHYLQIDGKFVGIDRSAAEVEKVIHEYFHGDGLKYAQYYYEHLAKLPEYGKFDIIAHFDIVAKQCENTKLLNTDDKKYIGLAVEAAEALVGKIPLFEVNTGCISRGYRTTPYPTIPILKELNRLGFGAVISSDCHDGKALDCYFNESYELLKHCGFQEYYILTNTGFQPVKL